MSDPKLTHEEEDDGLDLLSLFTSDSDDVSDVCILDEVDSAFEDAASVLSEANNALNDLSVPCFEVKTVPGKGQGMFAVRDVWPGEIVCRERPMIVMPDAIFELEDHDRIEAWLDRRINR